MEKNQGKREWACFAGGCFWCTMAEFDGVEGILSLESGYTGGHVEDPSYEYVCTGRTGHVEALKIEFDPQRITYWKLLERYFRHIDPGDEGGSFVDRGSQYASAIFYHSEDQKNTAKEFIRQLNASGLFQNAVATQILPAQSFYPAESHHQNYHKTHAVPYKFYRLGSGRDTFIKKFWINGPGRDLKLNPPEGEGS